MTSLIDKLKIKTGRRLSQTELEAALPSRLSTVDFERLPLSTPRFATIFRFKESIFHDGEKIVKNKVTYTFAETHDASERHRTHSGYYHVKDETYWYNNEGLLVESRVTTNVPAGRLLSYKQTQPISPGSFIEKTVKSFKN